MKYALLIARQRSGTGALGSVIDKHPKLKYLGEVFHPSNVGHGSNFFTHYLRAIAKDPNNALPDAAYGVFERFVEAQSKLYDDRIPVIDVKYRSLHHLDGGWRGLVQRPFILQEAISRDMPILQLTRKNAVQSFVSGRLAEANQVWHARNDQEIKVNSTVVNVRALSNYIVNCEREMELLQEWTENYSKFVSFDYSDMIDGEGKISRDVTDKIAKTIGVDPFENRSPNFKKQAPLSVSASIENIDLVRRALSGTGNLWMLK